MILRDFLPAAHVREFVQCYRIVDFIFDKSTSLPIKAYPPKPEECLFFCLQSSIEIESANLKKSRWTKIFLVGQQTAVNFRRMGGSDLSLQIVFQPTALYRLTGIPSSELTDRCVDAENIFTVNTGQVFEQLQFAGSYREMLTIAERFVEQLIKNQQKEIHLLDTVSRLMLNHDGKVSLDWLAHASCLSSRQFKRKFYDRVGTNPKTFARIIRLTHAFNLRNANPKWDWLRIALECSYFDYQHLVKDYKDFTGCTPNEFHLLESNSPERVLGLTAELYKNRARKTLPSF